MIRRKKENENLLLSIIRKCESLSDQTHRKAEETLDVKLNKPRETFHFNPPLSIEGDWMIGLLNLEVYISLFDITEEKNIFQLYTDNFDEISFTEMKHELGEIPKISDNTPIFSAN